MRRVPALINPFRPNLLGAAVALSAAFAAPTSATAQSCVNVVRVDLTGVTLLSETELQAGFRPLLGCIGLEGLNTLLEQVTLAYVDAGYIAARAYLPEQDLSDGSLTISVIVGGVSAIDLRENGLPAPLRAATAFPGMVNRPLELRRLEQGLAQINRLPSSDATSQLVPGAEPGDSVVAVEITQGRPWSASVTADNRGTSSTGEHTFGLTF
ncbi:MAG TPA: ShlB/FhaC/HecB family hemolysin secretion/activation protein, partial [Roseibacterium sp.]|nr:ShlB/FhaC/HecB family hemolysin secretion/activation protein [Roseibacterium sp.]